MANKQDRQGEQEWAALTLYFEFFKHFTTLTTAVAIIVLGFFGVLDLKPTSFIAVLVALAIPLLCRDGKCVATRAKVGILEIRFRSGPRSRSCNVGSSYDVLLRDCFVRGRVSGFAAPRRR